MGTETKPLRSESRPGDSVAKYAAIASLLILFVGTYLIIFTNDYISIGWFACHPPLQALAIALFTYGILTLQPTNQPSTKAAGLERHQMAILLFGLPVLSLGTFAIIYKKYPYANGFVLTWHGTVGYISILWLLAQILMGGASVWGGGAALGGGNKAKAMWKYHRLSGYLLLPLLFGTAHLGGAYSTWVVRHSTWTNRTLVYTIAPTVALVSIYVRARASKMKFF